MKAKYKLLGNWNVYEMSHKARTQADQAVLHKSTSLIAVSSRTEHLGALLSFSVVFF